MTEKRLTMMSRDHIRMLQLERLQMLLNRAYLNVDFYRQRMDAIGMLPEDVASFADFSHFPFTTSENLAAHYPYGLFAVPLKSVVRLVLTYSQDGKPIVVGSSQRDLHLWRSLMVRLYKQLEVSERDIVQIAFNFSLFPGAFTFNHAVEHLGATLAPSATISARLQFKIMKDFRCTVLATTPSFALHMLDTLEAGIADMKHPADLHLRLLILGPEPLPDQARKRIEQGFGVPAYSLYGVSEMVHPGIAGECVHRNGFHLAEDHFLAEIVDPLSGDVLPAGHEGELVITTLSAEAYPLIRYRTGDITTMQEIPCPCGLHTLRIAPVLRRTDSRISVRGIPFQPRRIGDLLKEMDSAVSDFRLIVHTRWGVGDYLELMISRPPGEPFKEGGKAAYLERIRAQIRRTFGFGARVLLVDANRLPHEGLFDKTILLENSSQNKTPN